MPNQTSRRGVKRNNAFKRLPRAPTIGDNGEEQLAAEAVMSGIVRGVKYKTGKF